MFFCDEIKLICIGENEYRVDGRITQIKTHEKSVTVDGERYHRTWDTERVVELSSLFKKRKPGWNWHEFIIDQFEVLGEPKIVVWDYCEVSYHIAGYSQNHLMNLIYILEDVGAFKNIKPRRTDSGGYISGNEIIVPVDSYGSGYYIGAEMKLMDYLCLNFKVLRENNCAMHQIHIFAKYQKKLPEGVLHKTYLSDSDRLLFTLKLFDNMISEKERYQLDMSYYN